MELFSFKKHFCLQRRAHGVAPTERTQAGCDHSQLARNVSSYLKSATLFNM
jgi:hypothetical protein